MFSVHNIAFWEKTFPCLFPWEMFKSHVQCGVTSDSEEEHVSGVRGETICS